MDGARKFAEEAGKKREVRACQRRISSNGVCFASGSSTPRIFNLANLLLVAAIDIAGLAVAFPIGIGLALVMGAVRSYLISPHGNPLMLFGGILLVVVAIVLDAAAYRLREREHAATSRRGVVLSLFAGLLMGIFYPFVSKAMSGAQALGP